MRIWDYLVTFGSDGDLPLPNLSYLATDYRFYLERGVEGMFVQHEHPISADLRDLKLWVLAKLLEDPQRKTARLIRDFTNGYYGPAGKYVRRYLCMLDEATDRHDHIIGHRATASDYVYIDALFATKASRAFDRAERVAGDDPVLLRRVRHARLSLDRATLKRWDELVEDWVKGGKDEAGFPLDADVIAARYLRTWIEQVELRLHPDRRRHAVRGAEKEVKKILERMSQPTISE